MIQTMNTWFAVQRVSQFLMMFLAVAILAMPLVHEPQEVEAGWVKVLGIASAALGLIALGYTVWTNRCGGCGQHDTDHSATCPAYHTFYTCKLSERWHHGRCTSSDRN